MEQQPPSGVVISTEKGLNLMLVRRWGRHLLRPPPPLDRRGVWKKGFPGLTKLIRVITFSGTSRHGNTLKKR